MATKTLIFRPVASVKVMSQTVATDDYLLVDETEADDDSTCTETDYNGENFLYLFDFSAISDFTTVTAVRAVIRYKKPSSFTCYMFASAMKDLAATAGTAANRVNLERFTLSPPSPDTWVTEKYSFTDVSAAVSAMSEKIVSRSENQLSLSPQVYSGDKGAYYFCVTQLYIEVDFEDGAPLYIKESGEWVPLAGKIYKKQNGAWTETDTSSLEGTKAIVSWV